MSDPYSSIPSTGKLKLKGVKDSKVSKKKKPTKKASVSADDVAGTGEDAAQLGEFEDRSVVLRQLEDEDKQIAKEDYRGISVMDGKRVEAGASADGEDAVRPKTEAERRYEEQRRKRLEDRLKKEGVKSHKQRVEELNRYLSGLSEHHDMPKIGPG